MLYIYISARPLIKYHSRLIHKIKTHGIGCFVASRIESWLSNRYQKVVLNGHMSDWLPVLSGVP